MVDFLAVRQPRRKHQPSPYGKIECCSNSENVGVSLLLSSLVSTAMPTRTPTTCPQLLQLYFPARAVRFPSRCFVIAARQSSNDASLPTKSITFFPSPTDQGAAKVLSSQALARLPTSSVLRSLFLGAFFSSSLLFTPGFALLKKVANSPSSIWNPDKNPLIESRRQAVDL